MNLDLGFSILPSRLAVWLLCSTLHNRLLTPCCGHYKTWRMEVCIHKHMHNKACIAKSFSVHHNFQELFLYKCNVCERTDIKQGHPEYTTQNILLGNSQVKPRTRFDEGRPGVRDAIKWRKKLLKKKSCSFISRSQLQLYSNRGH